MNANKKKYQIIKIAGAVWAIMGLVLIYRGINYMPELNSSGFAIALSIGLILGFAKGKFVISKAGLKNAQRIMNLADPVPVYKIFPIILYFLIPLMIGLGFGIRALFGNPSYVSGGLFCGIGAALVGSSLVYFSFRAE